MAIGLTDITGTDIANELGIAVGTNRLGSSLTRNGLLNKWSFRRPGGIIANVTTKLIEFTPFTQNDKTGDFREYSQGSNPPETEGNFTVKYDPGETQIDLTFTMRPGSLNIKEIGNGGDYYTFKFYSSATARANKTGAVKSATIPINYNPVTPPPGHTNSQTQRPESIQLVTVNNVTTSHSTLYLDSYVSTVAEAEVARFPDSFTDITVEERVLPFLKATRNLKAADLPSGNSPAGNPWTVTGSRFQINDAATPKCAATSINMTIGSTAYNFYWTVIVADTFANFYAAGISGITIRTFLDDGSMSHDQLIAANTTNVDPLNQRNQGGNIVGASFQADDQWEIYYDESAGISYNGIYSAC